MKKLTLLFIILLATQFNNAQNLFDRIPHNAEFAIQFNLDKMDKIYSHKKVLKNDMWKKLAEDMDMKSLTGMGIDLAKPFMFSVDLTDSCSYFSVHAHVANEKMFYEFLARQSKNMDMIKDYKGSGYTLIKSGRSDQAILGKGTVSFIFADLNRQYRRENLEYLMEVYYEEIRDYEYEYQQRDAIEGLMAIERTLGLLKNNPKPFSKTDCFKLFDKTNEVTFWMNKLYSQLAKTIDDREFRQFSNVFSTFEGYQAADFSMDKGALNMEMKMNFEKDIQDDILEITQGRTLKKDFLKYIPKDRMAIYFMSINPKAYYNWIKKSMVHSFGGNMISDASLNDMVEIIETLIDEDAISKLVSGDVLMSFNGIESRITEYKSSRYNEDFEMEDVIRKEETEYAEFTIVIGLNNYKFFEKIQNIMKRENLLSEKDGYLMIPPNRDLKSGMGIHMNEERMILSTDFDMLANLKEGKFYEGHNLDVNSNFYVDARIQTFFNQLAEESNRYSEYTFYDFMRSTFDRLVIMSNPNDKQLSASGKLEMIDKKQNVYITFMNAINNLYVKNELKRNENRYQFYSDRINKLIKKYEALSADKKSMKGDEVVKAAKEALKSKEAKGEPYMLKEIIWGLEEIIDGKDYEPEYYHHDGDHNGHREEIKEE